MKLKVGVIFGGASREREVSFAGGRTVYDNLNKSMYEAIPLFLDAKGNLVLLNWEFVYRGTIRDFFPPATFTPPSPNNLQIYADSLSLDNDDYTQMLSEIGQPTDWKDLPDLIDLAFLALHGFRGEDGSIQGLLEWLNIPYTGAGISASSIGMNKVLQKQWMKDKFNSKPYLSIKRNNWLLDDNKALVINEVQGLNTDKFVVKPANQGSSLGVSVLSKSSDASAIYNAIEKAFFRLKITKSEWEENDKIRTIRSLTDLREGLGLPLFMDGELVVHPEELLQGINNSFKTKDSITLVSQHAETEVLVEAFIEGQEFSCVVVDDEKGDPLALPPTGIGITSDVYDYNSKYLPGLSRKETPINLPFNAIEDIRRTCEKLYAFFGFNVYARIDGFYGVDGKVYLNDPNTTSGMLPSSFFFHQAAEIGLTPAQFLHFIIGKSLQSLHQKYPGISTYSKVLEKYNSATAHLAKVQSNKIPVAVVMGGYSTERHISVESGRNIFEKLASSEKYAPYPLFLAKNGQKYQLFTLPINVMLKDNADDIAAKILNPSKNESLNRIRLEFSEITKAFGDGLDFDKVEEIQIEDLKEKVDRVFIALHGRPGEDGDIQQHLEKLGLPYNGSGPQSSQLTIDKFETNNKLRAAGIPVANNFLMTKDHWQSQSDALKLWLNNNPFPIIAKPSDDGCSSAVLKIDNQNELKAYAEMMFREKEKKPESLLQTLKLSPSDEFPQKDYFLVEEMVQTNGADKFLEITGGLITSFNAKGQIEYKAFEPSEALASKGVLSLAEKFLAGEGQNITPARFDAQPVKQQNIANRVKQVLEKTAQIAGVEGYARIDAFVRIFENGKVEVVIIEINSLPGMTPATCIYHQAAIEGLKPLSFIDRILEYGVARVNKKATSLSKEK